MRIQQPIAGLCLCFAVATTPAMAQTPVDAPPPAAQPAPAPPSVTRLAMPGFSTLVKPLGGDFRRLASQQNLLLAGVGGGTASLAHQWDANLSNGRWGKGAVEEALEPGRVIGGLAAQTGGAFATYLIGRATGQARIATVGADLFRAQVVAQATTQAIKFSARRTRPDGTTLSFPSGHTSSSFATATVLQSHFGWKAGVPAYAAASLVAVSRMHSERHYLSDVIFGATIGVLAGRSVMIGTGAGRFSVSPMAAPGGIGVNFVHIGQKK